MAAKSNETETCALCGCRLNRGGEYATQTVRGRSHATRHHYVAERFFGRSANRKGTVMEPTFDQCPWDAEGKTAVFCYECHEMILHNPVLLPDDIQRLAELVAKRGLSEHEKPEDRVKLAGRIQLLHEVIHAGIQALTEPPK